MTPFGDRVPGWPALAAAFALGGAMLLAVVAPLVAAVPAAVAGLERTAPAVVAAVARLTRPVSGEQLGLRAPDDLPGALVLTAAAAVALGVLAALWSVLGDPRGALAAPPELDTRSLTAQLYDVAAARGCAT